MNYHVISNETDEHLLNDDGHRIIVSDITKKSFDMFKNEFNLLGNVRLEPVDGYEDTPVYHWYEAKNRIEGDSRRHWVNGRQYIRFTEEPSYEMIERYDLREKGIGDMEYIKGVG